MMELGYFSFLLLRPSKTSEALELAQIFDSWSMPKKLGMRPGLYGKSVLYLASRLIYTFQLFT